MHHGPQKGTAPETAARSQDKCSRTPAEPLPTVHPDKLQAILDSAIAAEAALVRKHDALVNFIFRVEALLEGLCNLNKAIWKDSNE
jgi:hypothetical protein